MEPMFIELCTPGVNEADQQTAELGSTYTGCWEQSKTVGLPTLVTATVPVPPTVVLKSPPVIIPAPLVRLMSQVSEESTASRLRKLAVIPWFSSSTRKTTPHSPANTTPTFPVT